MKKTYISPLMDVIELNNSQMLLAGSVVLDIMSGDADPVEADAPLFSAEELNNLEY